MKNKIIQLETDNKEYVSICKRNDLLVLHVGYYEAEFTNRYIFFIIRL